MWCVDMFKRYGLLTGCIEKKYWQVGLLWFIDRMC